MQRTYNKSIRLAPYSTQRNQQKLGPNINNTVKLIKKTNSLSFFKDILLQLPGDKRIVYESLKRFGIFQLYIDSSTSNFTEAIDNMQNLWDYEGYIYISCNGNGLVYHIVKGMYTKLNVNESMTMLKSDYFFNK